jgi:hypothetical protein
VHKKLQFGLNISLYYSSAAEEEIAKQFPTELWRALKFSITTSIANITFKIRGALFKQED